MTQILYVQGVGLIAGDLHGQVHLFGEDLRLLRSSPVVAGGAPLCATAVADGLVVGKDLRGNLTTWSLATLDLVCRVDCHALCEGPEPANPVAGRGLGVWRGRVYTSNAADSLVVLDLATLAVERIVPEFLGGAAVECFCTDHPEVHAAADRNGRLYLGSLATLEFRAAATADPDAESGRAHPVRSVRLDQRHQCFQALQADCADGGTGIGNGVVVLGLDGAVKQRILYSRYAMDLLEISPDSHRLYSTGREGVLYVLDNGRERPRVAKTISGFPHEATGLAVGAAGCVYVLMLSNELVKLDAAGECVDGYASARRQGVWDLQADLERPDRLYCGTDEGVAVIDVEYPAVGGPVLRTVGHHRTSFGMTRRLVAIPGGYVGLAHNETVFRCNSNGKLLWSARIDDHGHGLAVSPERERALVACGIGGLELDTATGEQLSYLSVDGLPLRAAAYGPAGERILVNEEGIVCAFAPDSEKELWWMDLGCVVHRLWRAGGYLYAAGSTGLAEIDLKNPSAVRTWEGPGQTVCEAAVIEDGSVYLAAHDGRLLGYGYAAGEHRGEAHPLPDLVRTLALLRGPDGARYLLAGGRGGYLSTYAVRPSKGGGAGAGDASAGAGVAGLVRLRETRLARPSGRAFRLETASEPNIPAQRSWQSGLNHSPADQRPDGQVASDRAVYSADLPGRAV